MTSARNMKRLKVISLNHGLMPSMVARSSSKKERSEQNEEIGGSLIEIGSSEP